MQVCKLELCKAGLFFTIVNSTSKMNATLFEHNTYTYAMGATTQQSTLFEVEQHNKCK
eukprot:m.126710 g.126710  ORF g.126710 m.126710 type:complete len:58 (+) comp14522_c0_seq1:2957-3130(+)